LNFPIASMPKFRIEEIEISRAILGCDSFISWLYQGGDSSFKGSDGDLNVSKVLEVMKTCVNYGVTSIDLSPPLVGAFRKLQDETGEAIVGLGALQEWTCKNFTINGVPLEKRSDEIKATISSKLPHRDLERLAQTSFKYLFAPIKKAQPLTQFQIDSIKMNRDFFDNRLELYRKLNVKLIQFGGETADWLVILGRTDLLECLSKLISSKGFTPILICHLTSIVLPIAEKEVEVAGYIVPLNKLSGLITLHKALSTIKNMDKPVIAMKTLAQGALAHDLQDAFMFIFEKSRVKAVMVGVSSEIEASQTFSTVANVLGE